MIRLLIVDDEAIERQAMTKILTKQLHGIKIVGEAANGRQAVEQAEQMKPDIILMDIKMPGMDGVEAVKAIRRLQSHIKFIMVTAFDTFDYAQEVMREGVKEYLLKPSRKSEIINTVNRVIEEVEQERTSRNEYIRLKKTMVEVQSLAKSEWVASLLFDHNTATSDRWTHIVDADIGSCYAVVVRFEPELANDSMNLTEATDWLKTTFNEKVEALFGPMFGNQLPILVSSDVEQKDERTPKSQAVLLVKELLELFKVSFPAININVGIGTTVEIPEQFIHSYNEALIALEKTTQHVNYLYYHPSLAVASGSSALHNSEGELLKMIKDGRTRDVLTAFDTFFYDLKIATNNNATDMDERLKEFWIVLSRWAKDVGLNLAWRHDLEKPTWPQLRTFTRERIQEFTKLVNAWQRRDRSGVIFTAKAFIGEHFEQALSLEDVAEKCQISPYYFSKVFKDQEGMTFVEYLTDLRIKEAKRLLKTERLSQKEICFQVGYRDPNYFSRVFKKTVGVSPSHYRNLNRS